MDFYELLFGRPAPGRRAEPPPLNYLREPERYPEVDRARQLPGEVRRSADGVEPLPDPMRDARDEVRRRERGGRGTPFAAASNQTVVRPFGDDFAAYSDAVEAAARPPLPDALAARRAPSVEPGETNEGRAPRNDNNEPLGIEGGTRSIPTRPYRGPDDRPPMEERYFPPIPRDREAERRAGIRYPDEYDVDQEWMEAERRADERWSRQEQTAADRFFGAVFGIDSRRQRTREELAQMRRDLAQSRRRASAEYAAPDEEDFANKRRR